MSTFKTRQRRLRSTIGAQNHWVGVARLDKGGTAKKYPPETLKTIKTIKTKKTICLKTIETINSKTLKTILLVDFGTRKTRKTIKTLLLVDFWSTLVAF